MTLREQIAADVAAVHINTADFAESLTYVPNGGTARTISGVVDEGGDFAEQQHGIDEVETLEVFVSRDSTTGIDDPQLGDRVRRAIDSDAKWYSYSGRKTDVDESAWTLIFERRVADKHGGLPSDR